MDRDGWMKAMGLFSSTCGSSKMNPQVLFFDGHDIHFDDRATHILRSHHISPFILKAGDSTNDQPNDNGPNCMLKRYYSISKRKMAETAWNHEVYSYPHELCSCGDVAFISTKISLSHH